MEQRLVIAANGIESMLVRHLDVVIGRVDRKPIHRHDECQRRCLRSVRQQVAKSGAAIGWFFVLNLQGLSEFALDLVSRKDGEVAEHEELVFNLFAVLLFLLGDWLCKHHSTTPFARLHISEGVS